MKKAILVLMVLASLVALASVAAAGPNGDINPMFSMRVKR